MASIENRLEANKIWSEPVLVPKIWNEQVMAQHVRPGKIMSAATQAPPVRMGRFTLPAEWVLRMDWAVMGIMARCCVVRAEHLLASQQIQYDALCPLFDEVPAGDTMPVYVWEVQGDNVVPVRQP